MILAVLALIVLLYLFFFKTGQRPKKLSKLAAIAFLLILAGLFIKSGRVLSYILIAAGIILALVDAYSKHQNREGN